MTQYVGYFYRLRGGQPMPVSRAGEFVLHSFMAEKHEQDSDTCATNFLRSSAFRGQGGTYSAANYTRLVAAGDPIYSASETHNFKYVEELE